MSAYTFLHSFLIIRKWNHMLFCNFPFTPNMIFLRLASVVSSHSMFIFTVVLWHFSHTKEKKKL